VLVDILARYVVLVVRLENRMLVGGPPTDSVELVHNLAQLLEVLENVDADAPVEAGGLEKPKVLLVVTALRQRVGRLDRFFSILLHLLHFGIDHGNPCVPVAVNDFMNIAPCLQLVADIIFHVIEDDSQRHAVINVQLLALKVSF